MVYGVYIDVKIGEGGMRLKRADPPRPASVIDQLRPDPEPSDLDTTALYLHHTIVTIQSGGRGRHTSFLSLPPVVQPYPIPDPAW